MEKENKYYNIIKNLVVNNKKYQDYDEILDDIIDDVFSHSKTVINSINDESVIECYLTKVVKTSLITVPKKLGYRKKIEEPAPYTPIAPVQEIKVNTEYVDKMINGTTSKTTKSEEIIEQQDDNTAEIGLNLDNDDTITVENDTLETQNIDVNEPEAIDETEVNSETSDIEENIELSDTEPITFAENTDFDLTDNSQFEEIEEIENFEEEEKEEEPEPFELFEIPSTNTDAEQNISDEEDVYNISDDNNNIVELDFSDTKTEESTFEIQSNNTDTIDLIDPDDTNEDISENLDKDITNENLLEESVNDEDNLVIQDEANFADELIDIAEENNEDFSQTNDSLLDDIGNDDLGLLQEDFDNDIIVDTASENIVPERKTIDFSIYEKMITENNDSVLSKTEISDKINSLMIHNTNKNLAKIYDLKYNQNLKISEIASELSISEDAVAIALKEIIDII